MRLEKPGEFLRDIYLQDVYFARVPAGASLASAPLPSAPRGDNLAIPFDVLTRQRFDHSNRTEIDLLLACAATSQAAEGRSSSSKADRPFERPYLHMCDILETVRPPMRCPACSGASAELSPSAHSSPGMFLVLPPPRRATSSSRPTNRCCRLCTTCVTVRLASSLSRSSATSGFSSQLARSAKVRVLQHISARRVLRRQTGFTTAQLASIESLATEANVAEKSRPTAAVEKASAALAAAAAAESIERPATLANGAPLDRTSG